MQIPRLRFILVFFLAVVPSGALCLQPPNPTLTLSSTKDWVLSSKGMDGGTVTALAISPDFANDRTLLAGPSEGGVFKSTDGGGEWSDFSSGLPVGFGILALAVSADYSIDQTLFDGIDGQGVWRYDDFQALFLPLILK